jgi:hypothetical protein
MIAVCGIPWTWLTTDASELGNHVMVVEAQIRSTARTAISNVSATVRLPMLGCKLAAV